MNKNFVIAALLIALIAIAIYAGSLTINNKDTSHVSAVYHTAVVTQLKHDGIWLAPVDQGHNTMMNIGLNWTIDKIFDTATASGNPTVIALGNLTSAETATLTNLNNTATNIAIPDCGLDPKTGTAVRLGSSTANASITYVWASTCNSEIVNTTALYNQTTNGTTLTMFAGKNFANSVTLQSGDQLNVTWFVWVS
jgi:hypothetical protein